jgi:hypothetical protein
MTLIDLLNTEFRRLNFALVPVVYIQKYNLNFLFIYLLHQDGGSASLNIKRFPYFPSLLEMFLPKHRLVT